LLAGSDFMLQNILLVILILDGIALTGIILLQKSEGGGLVSGGGGGQFMTARGTANLLTRTTEILTAIFFILALSITILIGRSSTATGSVVDKVQIQGLSPAALAAQEQAQRAQAVAAQKAQADQQNSGGLPAPSLGSPTPAPGPSLPAAPFGAQPVAPTH
jgi:preprotein translocase subunit SecG